MSWLAHSGYLLDLRGSDMKLCICCKYFHLTKAATDGDPPKGLCERPLSQNWVSHVDGETYYLKCQDDAESQRSAWRSGDVCGPDAQYYQTAMVTVDVGNGDKMSFDPRGKFGG